MGDFTVALNPPKTFGPEILPPINRTSAAARGRVTKISFKPHGFRAIRASVMPSEGQQQSSLGDSLVNSPHRNDVVDVIRKSAISNCLSETNLHNTVPGLVSKTRGKVCHLWKHYLFIRCYVSFGLRNCLICVWRFEIFTTPGITSFWWPLIGRVHLIGFLLPFLSKARCVINSGFECSRIFLC